MMTLPAFGRHDPDARGYFGPYGGRFVPETLVAPVAELEAAYFEARKDPAFLDTLGRLLREYVGRPTALYEARRLSAALGGARVFFKREDLAHTGAHKINNALGQALLAQRIARGDGDPRGRPRRRAPRLRSAGLLGDHQGGRRCERAR